MLPSQIPSQMPNDTHLLNLINHIPFTELDLNECQRLFHGRGKFYKDLDHVNIEWLPPVALITLYQEESSVDLTQFSKALLSHLPDCHSVQVKYRSRLKSPYELIWGEKVEQFHVIENGLKYHIELGRTQNTGLFLDMKQGRSWVKDNATNKRILNLFAYTCAFSVTALAGGASHVVNIDVSKAALNKGRENHRLNLQDLSKVTFEGVDIFKSYSRLKKHGLYDLMICDPPQFQKGRVDIKRDYKKIIRRIPELMTPGGKLMLCLNSPELDDRFLQEMVSAECPQCHFIKDIKPPDVFKEAQKGKGLKVKIYQFTPKEYNESNIMT